MKKIITIIIITLAIMCLMTSCDKLGNIGDNVDLDIPDILPDIPNINGSNNDELYNSVLPGAEKFDDVDLSGYELPKSVKEVKKETSGLGFVIKLEVRGYNDGMVILVGIDAESVVVGAKCIESNETQDVEKTYGSSFIDKDIDTVEEVDLIAGSTLTTNAYKKAVIDAVNTAEILNQK